MSGFIANYKDLVADSIIERNHVSAGWRLSKKGIGILVKNAYYNYPEAGQGDPTVATEGAFAYYKWDGAQFIKLIDGAPATKRKSVSFSFNSDLFTEQQFLFKGIITFLAHDFSIELSSVSYQCKIETDPAWVVQADLIALQAWIAANIIGDDTNGTKYWIKCLATYQNNVSGIAENIFSYQGL